MYRKTSAYLIALLLLLASGCNAPITPPRPLSVVVTPTVAPSLTPASLLTATPDVTATSDVDVAAWREDLAFVASVLEQGPDTAFTRAAADLDANLPSMNQLQIVVAFLRLLAQLEDVDAVLGWREAPGFESVYPIRLAWFDDGAYVVATTPDRRALLGQRLARVEGQDVRVIHSQVSALVPHQNTFELYAQSQAYLVSPGILTGLGMLPEPKGAWFVFEDDAGQARRVNLTPIFPAVATWVPAQVDAGRAREDAYWFEVLEDESTLYVQYNHCTSLPGLPFEAFVADGMATAEARAVSKLVIDLRFNAGGDSRLAQPLIHALWEAPDLNQGGRLFVLMGEGTLGAAQEVALQMQKQTAAIILSEPVAPRLPRDAEIVRLPNSNLPLWYSRADFADLATEDVVPDLWMMLSAGQYFTGQDTLLHAVLNDLPALRAVAAYKSPPLLLPPRAREASAALSRSEQWREDVQALVDVVQMLPDIHAGAFITATRPVFTRAVAELEAAVPSLEDHEIVVEMMRLLALLDDAHTRVSYWDWPAFQTLTYPIQVQWFEGGLYVVAAKPAYEDILGLRIVAVGEMDIEAVYEAISRILPHENPYGLRAYSVDYFTRPVILHALGAVPDLRSGRFTFRDAEGRVMTREVLAVSQDGETSGVWRSLPDVGSRPLYVRESLKQYYWRAYLRAARTVYVQYNVCNDMEDVPFTTFVEETLAFAEAQEGARFVLDLRRNEGGYAEHIVPLLAGLRDHPVNQPGRLFVLIDGRTFSSAVILASLLQTQTDAVLIGAPTGQGPNFYADFHTFTLPHSGIVIHYPTSYFRTVPEAQSAVWPAVEVALPAADYFAGRDPVLDAALAYGE